MSARIAVNVFAALGVALVIPKVFRTLNFAWFYFLRPSSIKRYLHGDKPFAIVTGATDGIGKSTAAELLRNGFNLVIHGRNEAKMLKVIEELRARVPERPDAEIRYFIADASACDQDFEELIAPFKDLHITYVLHNVGGSDVSPERLDKRPIDYIHTAFNLNALFPTLLTRALLPHLRRTAASGPVLVQFTGSIASEIAPPRLPIYAASKGFVKALSRGLDNDELFFGAPTGVRVSYLSVGSVRSENHVVPMAQSLRTPSSDTFARALVAQIGAGGRVVTPYWPHAMIKWATANLMSDSALDGFSSAEIKLLIEGAQAKAAGAQ